MDEIKVDHPEYGHVIFTGMTSRQLDVLRGYQKINDLEKENGNDQEFGQLSRKVIKNQ